MTRTSADAPHASPAVPVRSGWTHLPERVCRRLGRESLAREEIHAYQKGALCVLSSAVVAKYHEVTGPQNHVSVSIYGGHTPTKRRATDEEISLVRREFDMDDAEEDNHSPGVARHLFLPLHLPRGTVGICECKDDEEQVVEADGYRWSRAHCDRSEASGG